MFFLSGDAQCFPGRSYVPQAFSHGTLQCDDSQASQRFYTDVLGLEISGRMNMASYIKHPATPWYIVVLPRPRRQYLAPVNRFTPQLESAAAVEQAHGEFSRDGNMGITEVRALENRHDRLSFIFSDIDRNWWELTAQAVSYLAASTIPGSFSVKRRVITSIRQRSG